MKIYRRLFMSLAAFVLAVAVAPVTAWADDSCYHDNTRKYDIPATCTAEGYSYELCNQCGLELSRRTTEPALGHNFHNGACIRCGALQEKPEPHEGWTACGTCEWQIGEAGVLTIRPIDGRDGTLDRWSEGEDGYAPWSNQLDQNRSSIKSVTFGPGTVRAQTCYRMFYLCDNLTSADLRNLGVWDVASMRDMFYGCERLTSVDLANIRTPDLKDMSNMFYGCESLPAIDLSVFSASKVTSMSSLFEGCSSLERINLAGFVGKSAPVTSRMFRDCSQIKSITLPAGLDIFKKDCDLLESAWRAETSGDFFTTTQGMLWYNRTQVGIIQAYVTVPPGSGGSTYEFGPDAEISFADDGAFAFITGNCVGFEANVTDECTVTFEVTQPASCTDPEITTYTATYGEQGSSNYFCETLTLQTADPLGHSFVDGVCVRCGQKEPVESEQTSNQSVTPATGDNLPVGVMVLLAFASAAIALFVARGRIALIDK